MIKMSEKTTRSINWQNSKRLMFGSLVCLSSGYFEQECLAEWLCMRDIDMLKKEGIIVVKLDFEWANENIKFVCRGPYTMLDSSAYFESIKHVFKALQAFGHDGYDNFPFFQEIVMLNSITYQPLYLLHNQADFR